MRFDAEHEVATPSVKKGSYPFRRKQKTLKVKKRNKEKGNAQSDIQKTLSLAQAICPNI